MTNALDVVAAKDVDLSISLMLDGKPLDVSSSVVKLKVKDAANVVTDIICTKLPGLETSTGVINTAPPYDVDGFGGRVVAECDPSVFDAAGNYLCEIQVTTSDNRLLAVYRPPYVHARADFQPPCC